MKSAAVAAAVAAAVVTGAPAPGSASPASPASAEPTAKSEFWTERDEAYRASARGPFTAILAEYVESGGSVTLLAGEDGVRAERESLGPPDAAVPAVRIALGPEGFTASGIEGWAAATRGGSEPRVEVRADLFLGPGAEDREDLRLGRHLLSLGLQAPDLGRVLVYDPRKLDTFHGFPVFEDSDVYRVTARVVPGDGEVVDLGTTRGLVKPFRRAAILEFEIEGTPCRLIGFRSEGEDEGALFVPYRDATSGGATYAVGRYLQVEPRDDGSAPIDFNRSTNPWCAYSPFYNCVLPPEENVLPVAIRAGERAPEGH